MRRLMMLVLASMFAATLGIGAQAPIDPNRFEPTIQKFEAADKANPPVTGGIVFIGASSFARWTNLAESFPDLTVVNRGFGGSELSEAVTYAPRVVVPPSFFTPSNAPVDPLSLITSSQVNPPTQMSPS